MARLPRRRLLLASSVAVVAASVACASAPPDDPPSRGLAAGTFTRTPIKPSDSPSTGVFSTASDGWHHQWVFSGSGWSAISDNAVRGSGWITAIEFFPEDATSVAEFTCPDVSINIGPTWLTTLTTTFAANVEQGRGAMVGALTHKAVTIPTTGPGRSSFVITLDTPVYYDESDNLVIELLRYAACTGTNQLKYDGRASISATSLYTNGTWPVTGFANQPPAMRLHFRGGTTQALASDGTGPNTSAITPGGVGRMQALIRAADIAGRGAIVGLAFDASTTWSPGTLTTVSSVKLANVPASTTDLGTSFAGNLASASGAATVARDLTLRVPPIGRLWIPFNAGDFTYDGTSNLLIDVTVVGASVATNIAYQTISRNRVLWSADPAATAGGLRDRSFEPTFRFAGAPVAISARSPGSHSLPIRTLGQTQGLYHNVRHGMRGVVRGIGLRLASVHPWTQSGFEIWLGHTSSIWFTLATPYARNMDGGGTRVFAGNVVVPAGLHDGDWLDIPFQSRFTLDPTKNLVVWLRSTSGDGSGATRVEWISDAGWSGAMVYDYNYVPFPTADFPGPHSMRFHVDP